MADLCMNCFRVKGHSRICPNCGFPEGSEPAQPYYLNPGTVLGERFIVGTVIGAGNYGITYRCYDTTLGVLVAVKEFFPAGFVSRAKGEKRVWLLTQNQGHRYRDMVARFMMEARSIAQFGEAKDIVSVYDYFEENNTAYIIMEYIDDLLLQDYLEQKGRIEPREALGIVDAIMEAVGKIHAKGIIHRDISPDNIFISSDGTVKLFDFGSARLKESKVYGEKVIKPGYSPPEIYQHSEDNQGFHTDIYSIGAILYHMLTGKKPTESVKRLENDSLQSPRELGINLEAGLDRAVMEAMAVRPELRCQGIGAFSDALHGKRRAEYPQEKIQRQKRTRTWLALVSVLLVIAVVSSVTVFYNVTRGAKNKMFDTKVTADELTVWVDSEGMKDTLTEVVAEMQKEAEGDSAVIQRIKKESNNITYDIIDITEDGKTMDEALQEAKGTEEFPDLFVSDHVSDLDQYSLLSYQDNVCRSLDDKTHLYLSGYSDKYEPQNEMPTSFDVIMCYAIGTTDKRSMWYQQGSSKAGILVSDPGEMGTGKILVSSLIGKQEADGTIDLREILKANQDGEEYTYFGSEALGKRQKSAGKNVLRLTPTAGGWETIVELALLIQGKGFAPEQGTFQFDSAYIDTMAELAGMNAETKQKCKWKLRNEEKTEDYLYGSSILAGAGYRSVLRAAKIGNTNIPYEVYVPTVDGRMLVIHSGKLAISAESSENKQVIAMRLVYFALEQQHSNSNQDTTYPLSIAEGKQNNSFTSFFDVNPEYSALRSLILDKSYPCMVIGRGTGNIRRFAEVLSGKETQDSIDQEALKAFCIEYEEKY